jgi:thiol:disulfide interchange protein/DsbC/DsbD-like thiol-disulfide interchange protein
MRVPGLIFASVLLAAAGVPALAISDAADAPHVHVRLVVPAQALNHGTATDAGIYFKLEPGWHVYWKNPGDAGEPPHVKWTLPDGIAASDLKYPSPKRLPLGPLMDFGYEDEVLFPLTLNVANTAATGPATLHAKVDWLVCRASCIPGKAELEARRDVSGHGAKFASVAADAALLSHFTSRLPKPMPVRMKATFQASKDGYLLAVDTGQRESAAEFYPADPDIIQNPAAQKFTPTAKGLILELKKDANATGAPAQLKGLLELSGGRAFEFVALPGSVAGGKPAAAAAEDATVAPASPAASAATQQAAPLRPTAGTRTAGPGLLRAAGLAFLGGLLLNLMPCVFPVLFLKGLSLVQSGNEERHKLRAHGFVYAAGILISFWALVALLLALRAAGSRLGWGFQFQSPVFLSLMAGLLFFLGLSLAGQFEIGLTLTSAGGSLAAKQGYTGSFFTGVLAVIVATPCTAPFMGVALGYAMAQPAPVTFAVFTALALGLAAPYVALTLQPAWTRILPKPGAWMEVLRQAISVPIFATVIWLAWVLAQAYGAGVLAALLVSFLLLAIAGWFLGRWPAQRWATVVAVFIVLGAVGVGVFGPGKLAAAPEPRGKAENKIGWEPWSAEAVSRYQAQGRPVFVDFTASWCLSCQVNERVALNQPSVQKAFGDANVALLRADWTRHDEAITEALTALDRSGVPAYVLYAPGEKSPQLLPEVLTPGIVTDALGKLPRAGSQSAAATSHSK